MISAKKKRKKEGRLILVSRTRRCCLCRLSRKGHVDGMETATCLELQRMTRVYPAPFGLLLGWGLNDPSRSKGLGGIDLVHVRHLKSLRAICGPGDRMPKHVILRGARSKQRTP